MKTGFKRGTVLAAILLSVSARPTTAVAAPVLTGTFAGTAVNSILYQPFPPGPPTSFDGTPVSGKFRLNLTNCLLDTRPGSPFAGGCEAQPDSYLSGNIIYGPFSFTGDAGVLATITNTASSQTLVMEFSVTDPYGRAYISLTGGPNAFVDGTDYATLHPGKFDLATASIELDAGRFFATKVALSSLRFDQVSEPAGLSVLAGATLSIGLARRRRNRAAA